MKKLIAIFMALALLLTPSASAANGKVTYSGDAGKFIFAPGSDHSPTDLFPEFKDVMPGDTLTQKITVKNEASNKVKVKIYMRSLGAHEDSADFLSQLDLRVKASEDNEMAYMFDATADQPAQLTAWVYLGTLYSGGKVDLDVILDVPVELDNEYQSQIGYLDWEFKIEEFPIEDSDPQAPQTGDNSKTELYIGIMICSAAVMFIIIAWRRKKQKDEKSAVKQN